MKRAFHLGDILSITSGYLLSPRHMDGVYDILNFLTGDELLIHQLPRAAEAAGPFLLGRYPLPLVELTGLAHEARRALADDWTRNSEASGLPMCECWLLGTLSRLGFAEFEIEPMPAGEWLHVDPDKELLAMVIIAVG